MTVNAPVGLYAVDTTGIVMKDCGGNLQSGSMETCVAFAPLPGVADAYVLGDTKPESGGATLRFIGAELRSFIERWTTEHGPNAA